MEKKTLDCFGNEVKLNEKSFNLVQLDEKIHDTKFETKPTTFFKDSLKRFAKNKSSVVGAIIISIIILLSIIVPIVSPYDIKDAHPSETHLLPKLFNAGTGFWDGVKTYEGIPYDTETGLPQGDFAKNAIMEESIKTYEKDGILVCDFKYDIYEEKYGVREMVVPKVDIRKYAKEGYIRILNENDPEKFSIEVISDKSPVKRFVKIDESDNIICEVEYFRYLGYDKMPIYLFGTDGLGKDLVKSCFVGMRSSLVFAFCIAIICFIFGLVWGAISGYFGGNVDLFLERFKDILGGVPLIIIVTLFRLHLGDKLWVFALSLCITGWMGIASRTRTQFYRFKGREYVLASRTLGASDNRLIFRHILPNSMGTIVTSSVLMVPNLIFTEATLAYLGLGLQGNDSFGSILSQNQQYIQTYPALIVVPAVIISLLMISFNLFGNGLRDALNPSLKGSE